MGTDQFTKPPTHLSLDAEIRNADSRMHGYKLWCEDVVKSMGVFAEVGDDETAREFLERVCDPQSAFDEGTEPQDYASTALMMLANAALLMPAIESALNHSSAGVLTFDQVDKYFAELPCDDCGRTDGHDADCFYHGPY